MLPIRSNAFDAALSVAVIHHLSTEQRRRASILELIRVLKPGGRALISVWAFEQEKEGKRSIYAAKSSVQVTHRSTETSLPVHESRTPFQAQDILVPWRSNNHNQYRFYHVFKQGELKGLLTNTNVETSDEIYEQGNWCILITKK
ncbi:hypothetical protein ACOME3_001314 [Neoechinorhynchus agilis]